MFTPAPSKKQSRKAAKQAQAPASFQQDLVNTEVEVTGDEALSAHLQGMVHWMDNMMATILELSQNNHGQDTPMAE